MTTTTPPTDVLAAIAAPTSSAPLVLPNDGAPATTGPTPDPTPTVGRIVHYLENEGGELKSRAAIVVCVHNATKLNLFVFETEGARPEPCILQGTTAGSWMWPPRV